MPLCELGLFPNSINLGVLAQIKVRCGFRFGVPGGMPLGSWGYHLGVYGDILSACSVGCCLNYPKNVPQNQINHPTRVHMRIEIQNFSIPKIPMPIPWLGGSRFCSGYWGDSQSLSINWKCPKSGSPNHHSPSSRRWFQACRDTAHW